MLFVREVEPTRKGEIYFKRLSDERLQAKTCGRKRKATEINKRKEKDNAFL